MTPSLSNVGKTFDERGKLTTKTRIDKTPSLDPSKGKTSHPPPLLKLLSAVKLSSLQNEVDGEDPPSYAVQ